MIEYFVDVAKECINIGNFNSLMAIIGKLFRQSWYGLHCILAYDVVSGEIFWCDVIWFLDFGSVVLTFVFGDISTEQKCG